jgi:hypothetical protein
MSRYIQAGGPRQRFQSACGDAPSDAFLAGAIQSAARSGRFSVEAGIRATAPFSASGALPPLRSGQVSLDEAEHFPAQSRSQRRYAPMVFGIIPECRSASFGTSVQLRRNPQQSTQETLEHAECKIESAFSGRTCRENDPQAKLRISHDRCRMLAITDPKQCTQGFYDSGIRKRLKDHDECILTIAENARNAALCGVLTSWKRNNCEGMVRADQSMDKNADDPRFFCGP